MHLKEYSAYDCLASLSDRFPFPAFYSAQLGPNDIRGRLYSAQIGVNLRAFAANKNGRRKCLARTRMHACVALHHCPLCSALAHHQL